MNLVTVDTHYAEIFLAGDVDDARRICRKFCMDVGLCVTVEAVEFIYTGGSESGVKVGLTNYPRFPATKDELWAKAETLAAELATGLCQWSVMIRSADRTSWFTSRPVS